MLRSKLYTIPLLLLSIIATTNANSETNVYGKGHVSIASIDDSAGKATAISSHSSRFGVKGNLEKEKNLQVFYKMEWQVDMTDESKDSSSTSIDFGTSTSSDKTKNHLKSRSQYVGIKANWGELRLGRDDSPYKTAGKKAVEFFSDTYADYNNIIDKGQDVRADNAVSVKLNAGPGKLSVMYAAGSDNTTNQNSGDMTSFAYDAKFGALTLGLANQTINKTASNESVAAKWRVIFNDMLC